MAGPAQANSNSASPSLGTSSSPTRMDSVIDGIRQLATQLAGLARSNQTRIIHKTSFGESKDPIIPRLGDNVDSLQHIYALLHTNSFESVANGFVDKLTQYSNSEKKDVKQLQRELASFVKSVRAYETLVSRALWQVKKYCKLNRLTQEEKGKETASIIELRANLKNLRKEMGLKVAEVTYPEKERSLFSMFRFGAKPSANNIAVSSNAESGPNSTQVEVARPKRRDGKRRSEAQANSTIQVGKSIGAYFSSALSAASSIVSSIFKLVNRKNSAEQPSNTSATESEARRPRRDGWRLPLEQRGKYSDWGFLAKPVEFLHPYIAKLGSSVSSNIGKLFNGVVSATKVLIPKTVTYAPASQESALLYELNSIDKVSFSSLKDFFKNVKNTVDYLAGKNDESLRAYMQADGKHNEIAMARKLASNLEAVRVIFRDGTVEEFLDKVAIGRKLYDNSFSFVREFGRETYINAIEYNFQDLKRHFGSAEGNLGAVLGRYREAVESFKNLDSSATDRAVLDSQLELLGEFGDFLVESLGGYERFVNRVKNPADEILTAEEREENNVAEVRVQEVESHVARESVVRSADSQDGGDDGTHFVETGSGATNFGKVAEDLTTEEFGKVDSGVAVATESAEHADNPHGASPAETLPVSENPSETVMIIEDPVNAEQAGNATISKDSQQPMADNADSNATDEAQKRPTGSTIPQQPSIAARQTGDAVVELTDKQVQKGAKRRLSQGQVDEVALEVLSREKSSPSIISENLEKLRKANNLFPGMNERFIHVIKKLDETRKKMEELFVLLPAGEDREKILVDRPSNTYGYERLLLEAESLAKQRDKMLREVRSQIESQEFDIKGISSKDLQQNKYVLFACVKSGVDLNHFPSFATMISKFKNVANVFGSSIAGNEEQLELQEKHKLGKREFEIFGNDCFISERKEDGDVILKKGNNEIRFTQITDTRVEISFYNSQKNKWERQGATNMSEALRIGEKFLKKGKVSLTKSKDPSQVNTKYVVPPADFLDPEAQSAQPIKVEGLIV